MIVPHSLHLKRRHRKPAVGRTRKQWQRRGELGRILTRIRYAVLVLVGVLVLGTIVFHQIGSDVGTTWSDAVYMAMITMTTVGYGEIVPIVTLWERLATGFFALAGFGSLTFLFTSLSVFFLEQDLDSTLGRSRMEKEIGRLNRHFIVCGYGRVGQNIGRELGLTERSYVAVDPDEASLEGLVEHFPDLLFLAGDASDDEVLRAANIGAAEGLFAVTGDDSRNLMICITAKQINPNIRIVARCHEVRNMQKLKKVGADSVVSPDFTGGMRMTSAMVRPKVVSFLDQMLRSELQLRVEEVVVPQGFLPCQIRDVLDMEEHYVLVAMQEGGEWYFNPSRSLTLKVGQVLIVMASPDGRKQLEGRLQERILSA